MNPSDPTGTDPTGTDPTGTDPTGTDPTGTDPTGTDAPVTIGEIAEFLRHLRTLSTSLAVAPARDTSAERAAFAARKADLFTRIAAEHPDHIPTSTATPATARPGESSA
jgi:hypothetical protein